MPEKNIFQRIRKLFDSSPRAVSNEQGLPEYKILNLKRVDLEEATKLVVESSGGAFSSIEGWNNDYILIKYSALVFGEAEEEAKKLVDNGLVGIKVERSEDGTVITIRTVGVNIDAEKKSGSGKVDVKNLKTTDGIVLSNVRSKNGVSVNEVEVGQHKRGGYIDKMTVYVPNGKLDLTQRSQ